MTQIQDSPPARTPAPDPHDHQGWEPLARVLAVLLLAIILSLATGSFPLVAFILAVVGMIMVHELGHFITAKWSGMKVTEYFMGFGPRLWSFRKGETEYGIKGIPAGGYVKIIGMSNLERDIDPADEPRTYRQQSYPKRMLVAFSGVAMQLLIAMFVLTVIWALVGVPRYDKPTVTVGEISGLQTGDSPAQKAGFRVGDKLVSYDGIPARNWNDLPPYIQARAGQPITFVVERNGQPRTLVAVPTEVERDGRKVGFIGVGAKPGVERLSPPAAVVRAGEDTAMLTWQSIKAAGTFFAPHSLGNYAHQLTGDTSSTADPKADQTRPVSIVGVVRIAGQAADTGLFNVLYLFVALNIFVGVINLVPLLPFDGGHMAIATYERLRSSRGRRYHADVAKMLPVTAVVAVVLGFFMISAIWLDIVRPLANPFQ